MLRSLFATVLLLTCFVSMSVAEDKPTANDSSNSSFEKLKSLAGTWYEADDNGKPTEKVASIIRVTAGGSAVHETLFPGDAMEMVSVYHMDQDELVMTHYCMLGNQPKMKADPNSPANQIRWNFAGGTNLDPAKDMHMHAATLTFIDADHLEVAGEAWEGGKPSAEHCGVLKLVRKK